MNEKFKLIEERLPKFYALMESCRLCPRKCGVNRLNNETGYCKTGKDLKIASWADHRGEEPPISGTKGSGAIFSSNCTLSCCFCQNYPFSQLGNGSIITIKKLAEIYDLLAKKGVHNINWVTPTHVLPMLLDAWLLAGDAAHKLPIVYNCSGYETPEVLEMLAGIVDIFLPDIKYADNCSAVAFSGCPGYVEANRAALKKMHEIAGYLKTDFETGLASKGMIIRHLVLPNDISGTENCLRWLKAELGTDIHLSVMCQYFPAYKALENDLLNKPLPDSDYVRVLDLLEELGFENVWAQDPFEPGGA